MALSTKRRTRVGKRVVDMLAAPSFDQSHQNLICHIVTSCYLRTGVGKGRPKWNFGKIIRDMLDALAVHGD